MKDEIKYDQRNYRDHDERNLALIKKSIQLLALLSKAIFKEKQMERAGLL